MKAFSSSSTMGPRSFSSTMAQTRSLKPCRLLASQEAPIDQSRQKKKSGTRLGTKLGAASG